MLDPRPRPSVESHKFLKPVAKRRVTWHSVHMTAFLKRHLPIVAAIVVLILGGAVAAMAAGSTSSPGPHHHAHAGRARRLFQDAATYIGISDEALAKDLGSGESLGQVAVQAGKTEAGLVKALTATASSAVQQRLSALVKRPGGLSARRRSARAARQAAASYLGITLAQLRADLHAGKTLAAVADSTPGRSSAGLISVLLAAREAQAPGNGASSKSAAAGAARTARLRERITTFVERPHVRSATHKAGS